MDGCHVLSTSRSSIWSAQVVRQCRSGKTQLLASSWGKHLLVAFFLPSYGDISECWHAMLFPMLTTRES